MYYIIGSGPSGIACAQALIDSGRPVTILDAGLTLEPEREIARAALASRTDCEGSKPEKAAAWNDDRKRGTVPKKLVHGSDFPYREAPGATKICPSGPLGIEGSYAAGGFSNVWGGTILPYRQDDLTDWPISAANLQPAYARISKLIPVAAQHDDLAYLFPVPPAPHMPLLQSRQIERFMQALAINKARLNANGVFFGGSRLAVDSLGLRRQTPCIYCGQCLHGCPRELIYTSQQSLADLLTRGKIDYLRGITATSIEERSERARVRGVRFDGSPCSFEGERVFLAAGPLNSTTILLRSLGLYDHPVHIKDSQYFLFPLLQYEGFGDVAKERLHTLCQAFIEILDAKISEHAVHLQVYSYNDHVAAMLDEKLGPLKRFFPRAALLGRFLLVQGYLHSSLSASIAASLHRQGDLDTLRLESAPNPGTKRKITQVLRKLTGLTRLLQAAPASPLLQIAEPGRGFHSGGSFPMAHSPGPGQTDRIGRPFGVKRLHVVDSTVFPSIPATTITFTIMANAYRIGLEASLMDKGRAI